MPHDAPVPTGDSHGQPGAGPSLGRELPSIVAKIAATMFTVELAIMWALSAMPIADPLRNWMVDAVVLTMITSLIIGVWVIRPYLRASQQAQASAEASEMRWRLALESSGAGMWEADLDSGRVTYTPQCRQILGYAEHEVEHTHEAWMRITHPDDLPRVQADYQAFLRGESEVYQAERRMLASDGSWKWLLDRAIATSRRPDGRPRHLVGTHADVTARKRVEEDLRALATTDALTGLPNRRHFTSRLEDALDLVRRLRDQSATVLMIDIDQFKAINDTHGHPAGDAVLRHLAMVMARSLRKTDTAGRLGGEEFGVVLVGADLEAARVFAERLRARVQDGPAQHEGTPIAFTISIGVASLDPDDPDVETTMQRCDRVLYQAKQSGRNRVSLDPTSASTATRARTSSPRLVELTWRDAYACGCDAVDRQHEQLFDASNRLLAAMDDEQPAGAVAPMIESLCAQITEHFDDEEKMLAAVGYPHLEEHRGLHRALSAKAFDLRERHRRGELTTGEVFSFLAYDVTARHMLREDRKFFAYVRLQASDTAVADT